MTTPPPQSPNPYAQDQPPHGQPQAQAPYPPQGGYPQQPGQPGFPPQGAAPYAPVPPQPKRRFSPKLIRLAIIIVIGIGAAIYGVISSQNDADTAKVGDCMHRGSSSDTNPDLEVVKCSDSKAQYTVLAKISGKYSETEANDKCSAAAKDFQYSYTESGDGSDFLLCLKDYKK
ncbi:hypothetical protein ACIQPR_12080 [Streptomyces sp. NPDC091280]|uniref:LppU/SCO3897 family protein n=1 Tax=Streptomyces sp. NPDC091280 TaxID=3365984 RepID=UPI0037F6A61E